MRFGISRLLNALRVGFYPAFEPAEAKRFEALTREAQNARDAGDLAGAEEHYLHALSEARASSDPSLLNYIRHGLAQVYQEQQKYREAELIFRDQLEEALKGRQSLRRRSFEIKQQAWGETNGWIWVDSLAAHANALHKIGREDEAAKLDERV